MARHGLVSEKILAPTSIAEFSEVVREAAGPVFFTPTALTHPFRAPTVHNRPATYLSLDGYTGIVEHDVSDQVVVVRAGTTVPELQAELAKHGQCLPMPMFDVVQAAAVAAEYGPLVDEIGFNLPHTLQAQCGSWRDWILGMTVVQSDGTIAKCGSKAVKNVAGYDVQKLMIGARGTLAMICEVIFKTYPIHALPAPTALFYQSNEPRQADLIQRTLRSDFAAAIDFYGDRLTASDQASSTLWASLEHTEPKRFKDDWILRAGCGAQNLQFTDEVQSRFMKRAKEIFDPANKLNPGAMGIF